MMRILIVEDEALIAHNLAVILERSGYQIAGIAPSGEEAIEKARTLSPDLVLMDIRLQGAMDGIETAETIRSRFSLPVIFLTAYATPEFLDRAKRTYPFGYLVKPIRQTDLVSAIEVASYKHEMELKLRQREAWLATTLRCVGDGVVVTGADGRIEFINEISKRILFIQDRVVTGEHFSEVVKLKSRFTGTSAGDLIQLAILQGNTMSIGLDLVLIDASDRQLDIEGEISLCETQGSIVGTVFTFRDVTVRNYQEEHRQRDFGTRICVQLAGAVSNELKDLLRFPARSNAELPQSAAELAHRDPEALTGTRYAESISRMVNQLEIVRRNDVSYPRTLNLNTLISETLNELRLGLAANISLPPLLEPELHSIYADPIQLKEALVNLVLYLRDSMSARVIPFTTRNCAFERRGRTGEPENYVVLTIGTPGLTMGTAKAQRVFEPFSGADQSADKLDLRLFLVQRIISAARGYIRAQTTPGQGMSFEILLPQRIEEAVESSTPVTAKRGEDRAILVLHPDYEIRAFVLKSLEEKNYEALGAMSIGDALEWMSIYPAGSIALLIADWDLCEPSSKALTEQFSVLNPGMSILFTVDHGMDVAAQKIWTERGAHFVKRPFRIEELLGIVADTLSYGPLTYSRI